MNLMIAGLLHETNTFSPGETPLSRFCPDGRTLLQGDTGDDAFTGARLTLAKALLF